MPGRVELIVLLVGACTAPVERDEPLGDEVRRDDPSPVVNPEPVTHPEPVAEKEPLERWRWTPPLDLGYDPFEHRFHEPTTLDYCNTGECTRLLSLPKGARLGPLRERFDGAWALLWYATDERESIVALFDLHEKRFACSTDFSGTLERPGDVKWMQDAIVHSWSAGTYLNEVAVWNLACEQIETLGAAQVFVAPDVQHALLILERPSGGFQVELVRLRDDKHTAVHRLGKGEWVETVRWHERTAELVVNPGERTISVSLHS